MARRPVIEDAQILAAAREVFLEHGVRGTTADVAARAGISEGSIFNRFQSKDHLFRCAMHTGEPPDWVQGLAAREGRGPIGRELIHAKALHASGDDEGARRAIAEARARIEARAARIRTDAHREGFLTAVPENRETLALARAWLGETASVVG